MDVSDSDKSDLRIDYLHPELLSREVLIDILKERQIKKEYNDLNKCELLELYNQYILPLPQRLYGLGRRETRLSESRSADHKRKIEEKSMEKEDSKSKKIKITDNCSTSNLTELRPIERKLANLNCDSKLCSTSETLRLHNHKLEDSKSNKVMEDGELSPNKKKRQLITWP